MDTGFESQALDVVEKITVSKDPKDFIPSSRITKIASSLDPAHADEWRGIDYRTSGYVVWDDGANFKLACPTDFQGREYLTLENSSGKIEFGRITDHQEYDNFRYSVPAGIRGRFNVLEFPFREVATSSLLSYADVREKLSTLTPENRNIAYQRPLRNEPRFVDPNHARDFGFGPGNLQEEVHITRISRFVESMQKGKDLRDAFWKEPIVVKGQPDWYEVSESRHRFMAARVLGIPLIPVYFT